MVSVYFAAPLFSEGERAFNASVAEAVRKRGHSVFLPQEHAASLPPADSPERPAAEDAVFGADIGAIDACEVLLMVMDGRVPDKGACFELGYAYARGKTVLGLKTDTRVSEHGGDNVMLSSPLRGRIARGIGELLSMLDSV